MTGSNFKIWIWFRGRGRGAIRPWGINEPASLPYIKSATFSCTSRYTFCTEKTRTDIFWNTTGRRGIQEAQFSDSLVRESICANSQFTNMHIKKLTDMCNAYAYNPGLRDRVRFYVSLRNERIELQSICLGRCRKYSWKVQNPPRAIGAQRERVRGRAADSRRIGQPGDSGAAPRDAVGRRASGSAPVFGIAPSSPVGCAGAVASSREQRERRPGG